MPALGGPGGLLAGVRWLRPLRPLLGAATGDCAAAIDRIAKATAFSCERRGRRQLFLARRGGVHLLAGDLSALGERSGGRRPRFAPVVQRADRIGRLDSRSHEILAAEV